MALHALLADPKSYFETERPDGLAAAKVVALVALVTFAGVGLFLAVVYSRIESPPPAAGSAMVEVLFGVGLFAILLGTVGSALLHGVALLVGARLAGGGGSFGGALVVAGLGMAPLLVQLPVSIAVLVAQVWSASFPADPQVLAEQMRAATGGGSGALGTLLQVGATAWSAYVWRAGLRVYHDLDAGEALGVAAVLAVIDVVFILL